MSGLNRYVFNPEREQQFMMVSEKGDAFDRKGVRIKRGDAVALTDAMREKVLDNFGERCLLPEGAAFIPGGDAVADKGELRKANAEAEYWRLVALASLRSAGDRQAMAAIVGAEKNADKAAQVDALMSPPPAERMPGVVSAMQALASGWA